MEKFFAGHGRHSFDLFLTLGQIINLQCLFYSTQFILLAFFKSKKQKFYGDIRTLSSHVGQNVLEITMEHVYDPSMLNTLDSTARTVSVVTLTSSMIRCEISQSVQSLNDILTSAFYYKFIVSSARKATDFAVTLFLIHFCVCVMLQGTEQ